jgi:hypothetical protein
MLSRRLSVLHIRCAKIDQCVLKNHRQNISSGFGTENAGARFSRGTLGDVPRGLENCQPIFYSDETGANGAANDQETSVLAVTENG